jgi:hypothetical protein
MWEVWSFFYPLTHWLVQILGPVKILKKKYLIKTSCHLSEPFHQESSRPIIARIGLMETIASLSHERPRT